MIVQLIKQILIKILLLFIIPAYAEDIQQCKVEDLLQLSSNELSSYEKIQLTPSTESTEGASVEYYYSENILKAVKAIYYGETGKTRLEYYFYSPLTYVSKLTEYHYSMPIYFDNSKITSINHSSFIVCHGNLIKGIGNNAVVEHFNRANNALQKIQEDKPK